MKDPCTVELVKREVIESKLLAALSETAQVAILASKQDLDDMIAALYGYELGRWRGDRLSWHEHMERRKTLADGMSQLRKEAFP